MTLAWIYLAVPVVFEVVFAFGMKASRGFTVLGPSILTGVGVAGRIGFLTLALKTLPLSIGYPVWVGAGTVGTVICGFLIFGESLMPLKIASVAAIIIGVIGLKLASS